MLENEFEVFTEVDNDFLEKFLSSNTVQCFTDKSNTERNNDMVRDYKNGASLSDISNKYSLSILRVKQILSKYKSNLTHYKRAGDIVTDLHKFGSKSIVTALARNGHLLTINQVESYIRSGKDLKAIRGIGNKAESEILDYFSNYDKNLVLEYKKNFCENKFTTCKNCEAKVEIGMYCKYCGIKN